MAREDNKTLSPGIASQSSAKASGGFLHGAPASLRDDYLDPLVAYFLSLTSVSRGDSARGRGVQVLHFLNFVWSSSRMPLYSFRPHRKPASFLAMVVDLFSDLSHRHTELFLEGRSAAVEHSLTRCLQETWSGFCKKLHDAGLGRLASVLDEVVRAASLNAERSDMPAELGRLGLYMTPSQLSRFSRDAFFDQLPLHQVFCYLRFEPPSLWEVQREQHPVGGDLRAVIRDSYDQLWASVASRVPEPDFVTLFALLPVNSFSLFANSYAFQDEDFGVFYARLTDSRRPGRRWSPGVAYVGATPEDQAHYMFLTAADKRDSYLRRSQQLARIGLSSTFPQTIATFDAWLEDTHRFPELHTRALWQRALEARRQDIDTARSHFFAQLAQEASVRQDQP